MRAEAVSLEIEAECWLIFWRLLTEVLIAFDPLRGVCWVWPFSWWNWLSRTRFTSVIHVSLMSRDGACKTHTSCRPVTGGNKRIHSSVGLHWIVRCYLEILERFFSWGFLKTFFRNYLDCLRSVEICVEFFIDLTKLDKDSWKLVDKSPEFVLNSQDT